MSIRKIKANKATEDGDYIRIEDNSTRGLAALLGAILGIVVGILIADHFQVIKDEIPVLIVATTIVCSICGFFLGSSKVVRRVPKTDLVEIKRNSFRQVTIVLDDERVKRPPHFDP